MAIDRSVYEFYRKKLLLQLAKEEAGNFISDGVIFLIKRFQMNIPDCWVLYCQKSVMMKGAECSS